MRVLLALSASASLLGFGFGLPETLAPLCSPMPEPDLPRGYIPPAPCWQDFDTACQPRVLAGTKMLIDAEHKLAVIYGVPQSCETEIKEELERTADGKKNYGWVEKYGHLTTIGDGILVLSDIPDAALKKLEELQGEK